MKTLNANPGAAIRALLFLAVLGAAPNQLSASPRALAQDDEASEDDADGNEKEKDADTWFAITNADVYTGTGAVLRGATILAKNGVIDEIGYDLFLPDATETLDAMGMRVYPGLVAMGATSSLSGGGLTSADADDIEHLDPHFGLDDPMRGDEIDAHVSPDHDDDESFGDYDESDSELTATIADVERIEDSFDPFGQALVLALATGITTAEQSGAAVKLKRGEIKGMVVNTDHLAGFGWSVSNPASIRKTREDFAGASQYLREHGAWDELDKDAKKETKEPSKPKNFDAAAYDVLTGKKLARFSADDREDLSGIATFAQRYGFRPVIFGCREGWTVASELGRAGAYALLTPRERSPKSELLVRAGGSSIENAAILHEHGVQVAIRPANTGFGSSMSGITGRDLLSLPVEAAFGVRGGLPEDAAIAAISLVPARLLGAADRIGTLEPGKDLDAIVTDGDLLHYETFVQWAIVSGKVVYDKQDEVYFAHIRPRPEPPQAPEPEATDDGGDDQEPAVDDAGVDEDASDDEEPTADDEATDDDDESEDDRRAA